MFHRHQKEMEQFKSWNRLKKTPNQKPSAYIGKDIDGYSVVYCTVLSFCRVILILTPMPFPIALFDPLLTSP